MHLTHLIFTFFSVFFICNASFSEYEDQIIHLKNKMASSDEKKARELFAAHEAPEPGISNKIGTVTPIVRVYTMDDQRHIIAKCSGVLVSESVVVTAKHCLFYAQNNHVVIFADDFFNIDKNSTSEQIDSQELTYASVEEVYEDCLSFWCYQKKIPTPSEAAQGALNSHYHSFNEVDLIALRINKPLGKRLGYFKIHDLALPLPTQSLMMGGIPVSKNEDHFYDLYSPYKFVFSECLYFENAHINVLYLNCPFFGGLSGGPIFYEKN